ncbi:uncharacterized protein K02A2.6-like [Sitodiplosis mosellana]|uniref:uncharacterized protein K02A2.6-like n=1 Tax=Sitodiplosis mosellana TaxID=263140 RepID=UPI00244529CC|nr:uncharacterized protein K02A2.6-like [Sitodiplosis mosellana]
MQRTRATDGPPPFEFKADGNCGGEWKIWLRGFEIFAQANSMEDAEEKLNWMLHYAGAKVQSVYYSLPEKEVVETARKGPLATGYVKSQPQDEYEQAVAKLCEFFEPKQNISYERHVFRMLTQNKGERIDMFMMRLREQAERCDFDEQLDENIRDQITSGCHSDVLRRKILERGDEKLERIVKMARIFEAVSKQQKTFEREATLVHTSPVTVDERKDESVCNINTKRKFASRRNLPPKKNMDFGIVCGRCGSKGHKASDDCCPAKGKTCHRCGRKDHFSRCCFLRESGDQKRFVGKRKGDTANDEQSSNKVKRENVQAIEMESKPEYKSIEDEYEDIFMVDSDDDGGDYNKMWVTIGGIDVEVIVDSGTKRNVVDKASWLEWKTKNIVTTHRQNGVDINFKSYGAHPLKFIGMIETVVKTATNEKLAKFYVANEPGQILLGYETAKALGILKIGDDVEPKNAINVNVIDENEVDCKPLGKIKGVTIDIPIIPDVKPVAQPYRRVPVALEKLVDDRIEQMARQGIIEQVSGVAKWVSPLVVAPKGENDVRICVDMRRANLAVERENHPLPTMDDFLPHLSEAKWFSKLDIKQAYHQVEISEESREITTFMTRKGLFRYTRLMFGINCAPEIFQKLMEQILSGCEGVLVYIDDIVIYAPTKELHDLRLRKVLDRIREFNITLNKSKCKFGRTAIDFYGHILSDAGIKPKHDKVKAVQEFRVPKNAEEVRSFIGLVNYVGKFIPNLATISEPLRQLTKRGVRFEWGREQQLAFDTFKDRLTDNLLLGYYNVKCRTQLIADASPVGLGAVLTQFQKGENRVIAYASRSLTEPELNYAQTEKEALALVWAVERFTYYLYGREFELVTDHKALETLFAPRSKPCARIERWVMRLMSYKFKVIYKLGKTNIADPLSRLLKQMNIPSDSDDTEQYIRWIVAYAEPKAIKLGEISEASTKDSEIQAVKHALYEGEWPDSASAFKPFGLELCFAGNILLRGTRIVMPHILREKTLELAHEGHPGMTVMKRRLRAKVWWPKMDTRIEEFVKKCRGCLLVSAPSAPEPLRRTELPSAPWQHLAIDFLGPLPSGHYIFVVIDYYSRFKEVEIMTKIDSSETIKRLERIFARFGLPISIHADNGRQLVSEEFKQYCRVNNITLISTTPYWPQQNGEVERQNRSLLKRLSICQSEKGNWQEDLQKYLLMYRSTPHSTTLKTPAELMFNRNIRDKLPSMDQHIEREDSEVRDRDADMKRKGKEYADRKRNAKANDIEEGDEVVVKRQIVSNKLDTAFEPATHTVTKRMGSEHSPPSGETSSQHVPQPQLIPTRTSTRKRSTPSYYQDFVQPKQSK